MPPTTSPKPKPAKKAPTAGKPKAAAKKTKTATVTKKGATTKKPATGAKAGATKTKKATPPKKSATPTKKTAKGTAAGAAKKPPSAAAAAAGKKKTTTKKPLKVGSDAPDFKVKDQNGSEVTLASFKGSKNVVIYFYPKDNTPGCSKEACSFRDLKAGYDALDCVVLGVSADHEKSHGKFIAKFTLNFSLLADTKRSMIKKYGAGKPGDKIQRSTVLIDKEGKVAAVWNPVKGAEKHPDEVLAKLKEISSP